MKQNKTLIFAAAALIVASFVATPKANADGKAPGEGFYAGAFVGMGMGVLQADITSSTINDDTLKTNTYAIDRGGIGFSGVQGGGWAGWGMKTADDLYIGSEISFLGSDEKFELTSSTGISQGDDGANITSVTAQRTWGAGGAIRAGYYVNADTLFSIKGGIAVSAFDVDIGTKNETYYAGGPQMGASIETKLSKIDPNLSLRIEGVVTDYLTADFLNSAGGGLQAGTSYGAELTGTDMASRIGVQYSF
jgi:hypothetical protein